MCSKTVSLCQDNPVITLTLLFRYYIVTITCLQRQLCWISASPVHILFEYLVYQYTKSIILQHT